MRARFPAAPLLPLVRRVCQTSGLAGCNMLEGLGQDIQAAGRKFERTAAKARK
jgi:predicted small secreted protein